MKKSRSITLLMATVLILSSTIAFAEVKPTPVSIFVNDAEISTYDSEVKKELPAMIYNGRTLMPLKRTFELFGLTLKWDSKNQVIQSLTDKGNTIWIQIGNKNAKVAGKTVSLDVPARIIDSRTYVPLAFIAKAVGYEAQWDNVNKIVKIYTDGTDALNTAAIPSSMGKTPTRTAGNLFFDGPNGQMISVTETDLDLTAAVNMIASAFNLQAQDFLITNVADGRQIAAYQDEVSGQPRCHLVAEKGDRVFIFQTTGFSKTEASNIVKNLLK